MEQDAPNPISQKTIANSIETIAVFIDLISENTATDPAEINLLNESIALPLKSTYNEPNDAFVTHLRI